MLKLLTFDGANGEPSGSPFCTKAMCLLKMSGAEWEAEILNDPRKMPMGKLPVLVDDDTMIADSEQIRVYLEKSQSVDFDKGLDARDRAISRAVIRMVEEHLGFALLCDRWMNDENWVKTKKSFFGHLPKPLSWFVPDLIRKQVMSKAKAQGLGRFSAQDRAKRAERDIDAIVEILGNKDFLFGDHPSAADASVVPVLRGFSTSPVATELALYVRSIGSLMGYLERGRDALYPEEGLFSGNEG